MVCRYIIRIRFSCFNSYVWIRQRNSIHSTSCALLFISLFPKSTYLCFASFKLSKSRNDEYIYWCHREINRYFCTSIKARVSNDGVALAIAANIVTVTFLHYATVLKDYIYHLRKDYIFGGLAIGIAGAFGFIFINILFSLIPLAYKHYGKSL